MNLMLKPKKQKETYGKLDTIYNSCNFQLAKLGGGLLYRLGPIQGLGTNINKTQNKGSQDNEYTRLHDTYKHTRQV